MTIWWQTLVETAAPVNLDIAGTNIQISEPNIEPIDLEETKRHIRFPSTSEDTLLDTYIAAARKYVERMTGRQLISALWERRLDRFPVGVIELPTAPLISVVSVTYATEGSPDQTPLVEDTDYVVEAPTGPKAPPGFVRLVSGGSWPTVTGASGSVRVRYLAGYGTQPGDVPEDIKLLLWYYAGVFHRYRDGDAVPAMPAHLHNIMVDLQHSAKPIYPGRTAWV